MSLFGSFAKKLNVLNSRFNKVVRIANRASNIETQIKSVAKDAKNITKNTNPTRPAPNMPSSRRR